MQTSYCTLHNLYVYSKLQTWKFDLLADTYRNDEMCHEASYYLHTKNMTSCNPVTECRSCIVTLATFPMQLLSLEIKWE